MPTPKRLKDDNITLELPWPPTNNKLYATVNGRRVLSKRGRQYKATIRLLVLPVIRQHDCPLTGRLSVEIRYCPPNRRKWDLDGRQKALLDGLGDGLVYVDDSQIDELYYLRCEPCGPNGKVEVRVRALGA